ncbi:MAG: hypothetical protein PHX13_02195, partial [Thiovulaceae bacterium]|nr:hypothetical protein [Sulfurimonadaceae bacterium]
MYYTINHLNENVLGYRGSVALPLEFDSSSTNAVGSLTIYKEVVDIDMTAVIKERHRNIHYGLSKSNLDEVEKKLKDQKRFLDYSSIYDRINQKYIPLSDIII